MSRILLIDDDVSLREVAAFMLTAAGHEVIAAGDGEEGLACLHDDPDLVVTDIQMPGIDGMEVLRRIKEDEAGTAPPVIVLTAFGTVEQAVEAMKLGAFTYLLKPFARDELLLTVEQALHTGQLERDNQRLRGLLKDRSAVKGLVYASAPMNRLMDTLKRAAASDGTVLVTGESGTGKELVARACHDMSPRWDRAFVPVNCGAIPGELMESELFGHAKGAFTGAGRESTGRIRAADGGTLFLDEIAELPLALQPKLLRVLESKTVDPVGETRSVDVDFRLVCATNRDLEAEVQAGNFREDLYYRLNVLQLEIPPLRDRAGDVALLWSHFTRLHGGADLASDPDLMAELDRRTWRGNVRELKNINQRMVLMRTADTLRLTDLPPDRTDGLAAAGKPDETDPVRPDGLPLTDLPAGGFSLVDMEKEIIRQALALNNGNRSQTAVYLGIPRHVLVYRLEKYDLN